MSVIVFMMFVDLPCPRVTNGNLLGQYPVLHETRTILPARAVTSTARERGRTLQSGPRDAALILEVEGQNLPCVRNFLDVKLPVCPLITSGAAGNRQNECLGFASD
jgi:hypothetical protein